MAGQPPSRVDLGSIWFWFLSFDLEKKKRKEEKQLEIEWTKAGAETFLVVVGGGRWPVCDCMAGRSVEEQRQRCRLQ